MIFSGTVAGEVIPHVPPIDGMESADTTYKKLSSLLGPVVLKQTLSTVMGKKLRVETFFVDLRNGYYKTFVTDTIYRRECVGAGKSEVDWRRFKK